MGAEPAAAEAAAIYRAAGQEVVMLAKAVEAAGATIINTGIGWHEARVPTIATSVPRAAFADVTAKLKPHVGIPLVATNRINMPDVAEKILADGQADMVSMARPFLADPDFVNKAAENLLGHEAREVLGRDLAMLLPADSADDQLRLMARSLG